MIHPAWLIGLTLSAQVPVPGAINEAPAILRANFQEILDQEAERLAERVGTLMRDGQINAAREVRLWIPSVHPVDGPIRFQPLPEVVPAPARPATQDPEALAIRIATAGTLFDLAKQAAAPGEGQNFALADCCLRAVLDREPDHAESRRLLGFVAFEGGWATSFAAGLLKQAMVLHPKFGWVPDDWKPRLDRGELPGTKFVKGKPTEWLPADQADALRSGWNSSQDRFQQPWRITTEHFEIQTNVPLSEAILFGRRLEQLHEVFFSMFADLIVRDRLPLARRFANTDAKPGKPTLKHAVWYFAERSQYIAYLRSKFHRDESLSLGFYMDPREARSRGTTPGSYFYRDANSPIDVESTLYHEASHQLLFETAGPAGYDRNQGNYWVWEGLGTYFETLAPQTDGSILIGGLVGPRIREARRRIVQDNDAVPIADLTALNQDRFLNDDNGHAVYFYYAESMALTLFLMHHDQGRYRDRFLDYVRDAYRGRLRRNSPAPSLEDRLGVSYHELDAQLRAYLKSAKEPSD